MSFCATSRRLGAEAFGDLESGHCHPAVIVGAKRGCNFGAPEFKARQYMPVDFYEVGVVLSAPAERG
jgi:hypothetical protein